MGQLQLVGARADFGVRVMGAVARLGQGLGLAGTQPERAEQHLVIDGFAEQLAGGLLQRLKAQTLGVEHGAVHVEQRGLNGMSMEIH